MPVSPQPQRMPVSLEMLVLAAYAVLQTWSAVVTAGILTETSGPMLGEGSVIRAGCETPVTELRPLFLGLIELSVPPTRTSEKAIVEDVPSVTSRMSLLVNRMKRPEVGR